MIQIVLWIMGAAITVYGLVVTFRLAYRGSISAYRVEWWELVGKETAQFTKLSIKYDGRPAHHGLTFLHYLLVNDGYKDIDLSERGGLHMELPEGGFWLEATASPANRDPEVTSAVTDGRLTLSGGLLKRGEGVRIQGVAQVKSDVGSKVNLTPSFRHRFAEVSPVERRPLPSAMGFRKALSELYFHIGATTFATILLLYVVLVPGKPTIGTKYIDTHGVTYKSIDANENAFELVKHDGVKLRKSADEMQMMQFEIQRDIKPWVQQTGFLYFLAALWLLLAILVLSSAVGARLSRRKRLALNNLSAGGWPG